MIIAYFNDSSKGNQESIAVLNMKRTRLFRSARNVSSTVPVENLGTDSSMEQEVGTKTNSINVKKDTTNVKKGKKIRATVDLEMMKAELKQLEDPPITKQEKEVCSKRLQFPFFDVPCTDLAQKLLGKVLVRRLENGTILKGRIVETEAYLGEIDKASQTYQLKVTPRNLPMYMTPGTIYVYLTYGMYHCFNISSAEPGALVLIRALEVLVEKDYVELLRNSESKIGKTVKLMSDNIKSIEPRELCNDPSKICTAFAIDLDDLHEKVIWKSNCIWLENDANELSSVSIVAAPGADHLPAESIAKLTRYYVLGKGSAVLLRGVEPLDGVDEMRCYRSSRPKSKEPRKPSKALGNHELCNGPSKLCIAFQIEKSHCKYSMCSCKSLWIENGTKREDTKIVKCSRIGIDSAGPEWANKPLRYYIYGNTSVSKRDKKAEAELLSADLS